MPNHCTSCGTELAEGRSFCGKCGSRAALDPNAAPRLFKRPGLITFLAVLYYIGGAFMLLAAAGMAAAKAFLPKGDDPVAASLVVAVIAVYAVVGVLYLACGHGLWRLKGYGRVIALVFAWIGLLGIPIGTIVSILILLYLYKPGIKILFSGRKPEELSIEEVRQVEEVTKGSTAMVVVIVVALALLMILGIIAAIAIPNLFDGMNRARFKRTQGDIRSLALAVEIYKVDHFGLPPRVEDVAALKAVTEELQYIREMPTMDSWGHPLGYSVFANEDGTLSYLVWSGGADGAFMDDSSGLASQHSRNWNCDIAFRDGMFLFGTCE
jgi:general secretion pathway protein G